MARRRKDDGAPPSGAAAKGGISAEDRALWDRVAGSAQPLKGRKAKPAPVVPEIAAKSKEAPPPPPPLPPVASAPHVAKPMASSELRPGTAGLARAQAERLKRGKLKVEARLDLHGFSQAEAHPALAEFLARAQDKGKRCVLVVTGRGIAKRGGGVLRAQLPRWLDQAPNRERVLAVELAQPKDGGDGAFYVLLRQRRAKLESG